MSWAFHFPVFCGVPSEEEEPFSTRVSLPDWMQSVLRHLKLRGCPEGRGVTSGQEPHPPPHAAGGSQTGLPHGHNYCSGHSFFRFLFPKGNYAPQESSFCQKKSKSRWDFTAQFPALELTDYSVLSLACFRLFSGQSAPQDHEFLPLPLPSPGAELH